MKNDNAFIIGLVVMIALFGIGAWYYSQKPAVVVTQPSEGLPQQPPQSTIPGQTSTSTNPSTGGQVITSAVRMNQPTVIQGVTIRPTQLLEDSRCPSSVVCIQAGTVRVLATVADSQGSTTQEIKLGTPLHVRNTTIQLLTVTPDRVSTTTPKAEDYTFYFQVSSK